MYGKIFDSIYDGTLRANWQALVTFQQLIILADKDGIVDMTPHAIHGRTGIPLDIIEAGIVILTQDNHIALVNPIHRWGWKIITTDHHALPRPPLSLWKKIKAYVFKRDDYTCRYCGARGVFLECDHIHPVSRGGTSDPSNLATSCKPCNRNKGSKTIEEWRACSEVV